MATGTVGTDAHRLSYKTVHFIRKDLTFADAGTGALHIGTIPAGSLMIKSLSGANASTAFNGTTPIVKVGTAGQADLYSGAAGLALTPANTFVPMAGATSFYVTVDTPLYATTTAAGTTTGVAQLMILYIPPLV